VQGGRVRGLRIVEGALAVTGINARPLMLAFGIRSGAGLYTASPSDPALNHVEPHPLASLRIWWQCQF